MTFSILDRTNEVGGSLLLEASAGTGKTFAIEHLVVRLLLKGEPFSIDRILLVTFTRAAARELRARIHQNLGEAAYRLETGEAGDWDYLAEVIEQGEAEGARALLQRALAGFDEAIIDTIHGFCHRFLAQLDLGVWESFEELFDQEARLQLARDYLRLQEGLSPCLFHRLLGSYRGDLDRLLNALVTAGCGLREEPTSPSYELVCQTLEALHTQLKGSDFVERYREVAESYKAVYRKRSVESSLLAFAEQLCSTFDAEAMLDASLDFAAPICDGNLKKGASAPHFPEIEQVREAAEQIDQLLDREAIFDHFAYDFSLFLKRYLDRNELLTHDRVIERMKAKLTNPHLLKQLRAQLSMVVVDEFQDTDPLQWSIFRTLCEGGALPIALVGDPKQSIYRFRGADIYTYLEARSWIGEQRCHTLSVNYRSSPQLVDLASHHFSAPGLFALPRLDSSLPYPDVQAAIKEEGEVYQLSGDESADFAAIGDELIRRGAKGSAVLVHRWEQGERLQQELQRRHIPSTLLKTRPASSLELFGPFCDLLKALERPTPRSVVRALAGPLFHQPIEPGDLLSLAPWTARFKKARSDWLQRGLLAALLALIPSAPPGQLRSLIEVACGWEAQHGVSPRRLVEQLPRLADQEVTPTPEEEGVEIVSIHKSKGLEWEAVFVLPSKQRRGSPEEEAEKVRLDYVAYTRAKRRLYIPPCDLDLPPIAEGSVQQLYNRKSSPKRRPLPELVYRAEPITSYSALSRGSCIEEADQPKEETLPRGPECGLILHSLLERVDWQVAAEGGDRLKSWIEREMEGGPLEQWSRVVFEMVEEAFRLSLGDFSLCDIDCGRVWREMEFLFPTQDGESFAGCQVGKGALFGVIDLLVEVEGRIYLIDWKSNWLKSYGQEELKRSVDQHDYLLQASIYRSAIERLARLHGASFGGIYYIYLRGPASIQLLGEQ